MAKTVLYVHGTGVRKASFEASAARIASGLARIGTTAPLIPCLWGDALGARLHLNGASIPEYIAGRNGATEDSTFALWDLLARDNLFELRELAASMSDGLEPPAAHESKQVLRSNVPALAWQPSVLAQLTGYASNEQWQEAVQSVAGCSVMDQAIAAVRVALGPVRVAVGRAIVASLQNALASENYPGMPVATREALVTQCAEMLGGTDLGGMADWLKSRLTGFVASWATAQARRKREALFGQAAPIAGDIVMYQARGQAVRNFIEERIKECGDDVILVAHSLGGIACVDLLIEKSLPQVSALVTVGTQAPFLYEINALSALPFGESLPQHFPKQWVNFFDCNDLLSYKAGAVFRDRAEDVEVESGQPFLQAHSAYWDAPVFWNRLTLLLK